MQLKDQPPAVMKAVSDLLLLSATHSATHSTNKLAFLRSCLHWKESLQINFCMNIKVK